MVDSAHRDATQKAYKKAKKKRAKAKQAEKKREMEQIRKNNKHPSSDDKSLSSSAPAATKWHRVGRGDGYPKATDRHVDDAKINKLLGKRSTAKTDKNYTVSDEITETLIDLEIVYNEAKKEWHTRALSTVGQKAKKEIARKRETDNKAAPKDEPAAKKTKK